MFSKTLNLNFKFIFALGLSALLSFGCGLKIGEDPVPEGELEIGGYSCVNQISEKVDEYFDNKLNDTQVVQFVDCLKKSISDFSKRVGTQGQTVFSPEDLRNFINRITRPGRELNPELLKQFMRVKQTFVGGRVDQITKSDLASALNVLENIKRSALLLRPYVRVFNSDLGPQIPPSEIAKEMDLASQALTEVSKIFISSLKATENPYSLSDLELFMEEFRQFINWYGVYPSAIPTANWVALLKSAKEIATGSDSNAIRQVDWEPYLALLKSSYVLYLKTKYGVFNQALFSGVGLKNLVHVVSESLRELTFMISRRTDRRITSGELERWTEAMGGMGWIPFGLDSKTAYSGIKLVSTKIFGNRDSFQGLEVLQLLQMANDFEDWASVQLYVSDRFFTNFISTPTPPQVFGINSEVLSLSPALEPPGWRSLEKLISKRRPLHLRNDQSIFLTYESTLTTFGVDYDLYNISMTHLYSSVLGMIYRSYGQMIEGEYKLSSAGLQRFYEDFYEFGVGLDWLDPRSKTAGQRAYIEGNLFTYSSDGFSKEYDLSLSEGIDLVVYLLSGGNLTNKIYDSLAEVCPKGDLDIRQKPKLGRKCVETHLANVLIEHLTLAPNLREWLKGLPQQERDRYAALLLSAGFSQATSSSSQVEAPELSTISVIILYTESVLTRFDLDMDGRISDKECKDAFPLFKEFINGLIKQLQIAKTPIEERKDLVIPDAEEDRLRAIFEFILYYRRMPVTSEPDAYFSTRDEYSIGWNTSANPGYEIDTGRMELTEAFSVIINKLLNPPQVEPKESSVEK